MYFGDVHLYLPVFYADPYNNPKHTDRLQELPACIAALKSLEILVANDNKIASVDASSVQALSALATLDLRNNSITQLPPQLGLCTQLRWVRNARV